jgi:hypothetical protein
VSNFRLVVAYVGRPWPFSWGPLCLSGVLELDCDEAEVEVVQHDGSKTLGSKTLAPVTVSCRAGERGLATVLGESLADRDAPA